MGKYVDLQGKAYDKKPEHMTQLRGNTLVSKAHPRIVLRGKLDSLQAALVEAQIIARELERPDVFEDLTDILAFARELLGAEVLEEPLRRTDILGMDEDSLHAASHDPKKHFGVPHVLPDYRFGVLYAAVNSLRTLARETEISGIKAFVEENGDTSREDLLMGLNRLSSALYVLSCKIIERPADSEEGEAWL